MVVVAGTSQEEWSKSSFSPQSGHNFGLLLFVLVVVVNVVGLTVVVFAPNVKPPVVGAVVVVDGVNEKVLAGVVVFVVGAAAGVVAAVVVAGTSHDEWSKSSFSPQSGHNFGLLLFVVVVVVVGFVSVLTVGEPNVKLSDEVGLVSVVDVVVVVAAGGIGVV